MMYMRDLCKINNGEHINPIKVSAMELKLSSIIDFLYWSQFYKMAAFFATNKLC